MKGATLHPTVDSMKPDRLPSQLGRFVKRLDAGAWDNWLPLSVILAFIFLGAAVAGGVVGLGLVAGDAARFETIYTDIGIQTTAGIYAIIISLSLVAIQFAAQEYGHRIMEYYLRSVIFWSTNVVYLGLITGGIIVQAQSSGTDSTRLVGVMVIGSILALALLIPHFLVTASYLKPEFIIAKLLRRVDRDFLAGLQFAQAGPGGRVMPRIDRLLPVIEIGERSIDRGDLTTTRGALQRIEDLYNVEASPLKSAAVDRFFVDHLLRIGRKAVFASDEPEAGVETVQTLGRIGAAGPAAQAVESIDILGFAALRRDTDVVVTEMIESLKLIYASADDPEVANAVLNTYRDLVAHLATGYRVRQLRLLVNTLEEIGAAERDQGNAANFNRCLDLLEACGREAAAGGLTDVVLQDVLALKDLVSGKGAGDPVTAEETVLRLLRIERALDKREREAIAAVEFARREIVGKFPAQAPAGAEPKQAAGNEGGLDVLDLWSEPEE